MGQLLYVHCQECETACPAVPMLAEGLWNSMRSEDLEVSQMTSEILQMDLITVICQKSGKTVLIEV